jgi:DNA repair exonuclease SbcCD ATPase subunit
VRDNPESHFDDDDYELSDEQEAEKERIEAKIAELEEKQNNLEHEIEEPSDYSDAYDEVQEEIDNLQEILDETEPDKEPTEEMIDNKVQELVDRALNDPVSWLKDWGYEIKDFIDEDSMVDYIFNSDGYSSMSSYDGDYDIQNVNGRDYYVFRLE